MTPTTRPIKSSLNRREVKAVIYRYLRAKGWVREKRGVLYSWRHPKEDRRFKARRLYCWSSALLVAMAEDGDCGGENQNPDIPQGIHRLRGGISVVPPRKRAQRVQMC